jgi:hypothetical protein
MVNNRLRRSHFQAANAAAISVMTPAAATAQGMGVERCLGCRISRMSSAELAGTLEDIGAAVVKVV